MIGHRVVLARRLRQAQTTFNNRHGDKCPYEERNNDRLVHDALIDPTRITLAVATVPGAGVPRTLFTCTVKSLPTIVPLYPDIGGNAVKSKKLMALLALTLLLSLTSNVVSQEHQDEATLSDMDIAGINRVIDALENGYEAGDLEAVMATFADDAVLLEGRGINDGKQAIRDDHLGREFESMTFPVFRSEDRIIKGSGDLAYVYEMLTVQIKRNSRPEAGEPSTRRALYIVERQSDNTWKIVLLRI